jgi:hypothetical protein
MICHSGNLNNLSFYVVQLFMFMDVTSMKILKAIGFPRYVKPKINYYINYSPNLNPNIKQRHLR